MIRINILIFTILMILFFSLPFTGCSLFDSTNEVPVSIDISDSEHEMMNDYIAYLPEAFSERKTVDKLFPATEIPADELSWFLKSNDNVTVDAIKGMRFHNDDILIVFFYSTEISDASVMEHITININMYGSPLIPPPDVNEYSGSSALDTGFGVIAYSFSNSEMAQIITDIALDAIIISRE